MSGYLWLVIAVLAVGALYISLRGAPFVPTLKKEVVKALDIARLQPGMTVVDLGSGDGRLLLGAARRGCRAVGYELNPLLVVYSKLRTRSVRQQVSISMRDFWHTPLPTDTDVVFVFLAEPFMARLERHMLQESRRLERRLVLVSYGFKLPSVQPELQEGAIFRYEFVPQGDS